MDTKKHNEFMDTTFKSIKKQVLNCYSFDELKTSMLMIDSFTYLYGDWDGAMQLQEQLLKVHKEQSNAVTNGLKRPLIKRILKFFTT